MKFCIYICLKEKRLKKFAILHFQTYRFIMCKSVNFQPKSHRLYIFSLSNGCPAYCKPWIRSIKWAYTAWRWCSRTTFRRPRSAAFTSANVNGASSKAPCTRRTCLCARTLASQTCPSRGKYIQVHE